MANNSSGIAYESRVMKGSSAISTVEKNTGLNLKGVGGVTLAEVQQSNTDLKAAQRQVKQSRQFAANQKRILDLIKEIEVIAFDLAKYGFKTDAAIEALVASGEIASIQYQDAVKLIAFKKEQKLLELANAYKNKTDFAVDRSRLAIDYQNHVHGLSKSRIAQLFADKKSLATANNTLAMAAGKAAQIENADFMAALKREAGGDPSLGGSSQRAIGGGGAGTGGFWQKVTKALRF